MAKHIRIGQPVNAAETWAFEFLEERLPSDYLLVTNVEIPTPNGHLKEIDAIVFGRYAIYLIDVKGYSGHLSTDPNSWILDGRRVDNALAKANSHARVYAGRIRATLLKEEHAPWCQGVVFVMGNEGSGITLQKSQENLSVFDPSSIIEGLVNPDYCTTDYQYEITPSQRKKAVNVLGNIGKIPKKNSDGSDFKKIKAIKTDGYIQIWEAVHEKGDLITDWLIKEVDITATAAVRDLERLKDQAARFEQLAGALGIPVSVPVMTRDGHLSLAIRRPHGVALDEYFNGDLPSISVCKMLRYATTAFEQIYARGISLGECNISDILVSEDEEITIHSDFVQGEHENISTSFKRLFAAAKKFIDDPQISQWFSDKEESDFEVLKFHLARIISGVELEPVAEMPDEELFLGKYLLEECLVKTQISEIWSAQHKDGQFDCTIEKIYEAESRWLQAQRKISKLTQTYHPNLQRIFDVDYVPSQDMYAVSFSRVPGQNLSEAIPREDPKIIREWMCQAIIALNYLHRLGLHHGRLSPQNIICESESCTLTNVSVLPENEKNTFYDAFGKDNTVELSDPFQTDLVALFTSFISVYLDCHAINLLRSFNETMVHKLIPPEPTSKIKRFLESPADFDFSSNYLEVFELAGKLLVIELPKKLSDDWSISSGYMTFLTLDFLNDQRPKSRNRIVLNALRSRKIPGNKTNRNSMSSAVSRLKSAGIAEDHGKKIRLTSKFVDDWNLQKNKD